MTPFLIRFHAHDLLYYSHVVLIYERSFRASNDAMAAGDEELAEAWQAYHAGRLTEGEAACRRLLAAEPSHVSGLFLLGLITHQRGRPGEAADCMRKVLRLRPKHAEAYNNLGNALAAQKQFAKAEEALRSGLRHKPQYPEALNNLGNVLRDQGKSAEALDAYRQALELKPDYAECHNNLGIALARLKRYEEALVSYRRALELKPAYAEPQNNQGIVFAALGRLDDAAAAFRRALELRPDYGDAFANLGTALVELGRLEEAIQICEQAVSKAPALARGHLNLGAALVRRGRQVDAVECYRRALAIDSDYAEAHLNLGSALRDLGQLYAAEASLRRALELRPKYAEALNNLGVTLVKQHRFYEALTAYAQALEHQSDYADAHVNRALAQLASGDFSQGWLEYEWRWKCKGFQDLKCPQPRWDGGLLDGKTLLIQAEQGLAETLQFARYARLAKQRGGKVILRCPRSLHPLLKRTPGVGQLVADDGPLPEFDYYAPLLSLPRLLGTTLQRIPAGEPYLFPDERLVDEWRGKLPAGDSLKIGIAWQDNPRYAGDRERSIPLESFLPLAGIAGVELVSLQTGPGASQLDELSDRTKVIALADERDQSKGAFADTAAIMMNLDLVITFDSALAHLTGGLGLPVWVVLPHAADWRWLLDREDSPWYPTMRLFRQAAPGDWDEVFGRVADALREQAAVHALTSSAIAYPEGARAWNARGVSAAKRGNLKEATALFRRALRFQPDFAEAHNNLGNALRNRDELDEAIQRLEKAISLNPAYADAHHNLGLALAKLRRFDEAIASFHRAIEHNPRSAQVANSMGLTLVQMRRYGEAEASFRKAVEFDPNFSRACNNLGNVLSDQGKRADAVEHFERAVELDPDYADAYNNLGNTLRELGRYPQSVAAFERALAIRPKFAEAHNNLGIAWAAQGKYDRALDYYEEALRLRPEYPAAFNNRGITLANQGHREEAIVNYRRALELKPDYAEAMNNLGIVLSQQGDYEEAISNFCKAIELKPDYAEAFSNQGITLTECGRVDEAIASYDRALQLKPEYPDAYMNRALAFLVKGDFERGWREYEWRWKCKDFNPRKFGKPRWEGEPLDGRRIMLHAEQGFGDTFQFVRYARMVKEERGGTVIVWAPKPLMPLLGQCPYIDQLTVEGEALPEFDVHLPLLSLPKIFETTLETVPRPTPYLFAKPELVERWREEFGYIDAFKIGINWQGNPRYRGDRHRSIPLEKFAPLAMIPGVRLISLQKGLGTEQIAKATEHFSLTELPLHRDSQTGSFMDTAAILKNLDLVISSDTSLVHLAGGMGVPVWMALPRAADWRWLLGREDCPWYPTMRLFRQRELGNWEELFDRIGSEVWELVKQKRRRVPAPLSAGELLDRVVTLEFQLRQSANGHAPVELERQLDQLREACREQVPETDEVRRLRDELQAIKEKLRQCKCEVQEREAENDSSPRLAELLKSVRRLETERSAIKQAIDEAADREIDAVSYELLSQRVRTIAQQSEKSNPTSPRPSDAHESPTDASPTNGSVNGSGIELRPSNDASDPFAVFDRIYRQGGWCGKGSGPGSAPEANKAYIALLNRLINQTPDIRSVLDIGCGDWQIMRHVDLSRKRYLGVDVAASVVDVNVRDFGRENIRFRVLNPFSEDIPDADLIIMKDVAQHLPTACVQKILERIAARCRYALIANDFTEQNVARDIAIGGWRPVNVLAHPFNLPGATFAVWNGKHFTLSGFARRT